MSLDPNELRLLRDISNQIAELKQGLILMVETQEVISKRLEVVEKACTAEHPPSPLVEPLQQLAASVSETNLALRDINDTLQMQPDAIKAAIEKALDGKGE